MLGTIDFRGVVILGLMMLPFFVIGFFLGMLHMRENYLRLLRQARVETRRAERSAEGRENKARYIGYAVGYREGSRQHG